MTETSLLKKFLVEFSRLGGRLFRNNSGLAYVGKAHRNPDGSLTLREYRPLRAGLCVGSSDLIGWQTITVTQDMVGRQLAIFTAIEVKSSKKFKPTKDQRVFLNAVQSAGGIAICAYCLDDILKGVGSYVGAEKNLPNEVDSKKCSL